MPKLKKLKHRLNKEQRIKRLARIEERGKMARVVTPPHRHRIDKPVDMSLFVSALLASFSFRKRRRDRRRR